MRRVLALTIAVAAGAFLSSCTDSPTSGSDGVSITVYAERDALPVSGALVLLTSPSRADSLVAVATTDEDGVATLTDIDDGHYALEVSKVAAGQVVYGSAEGIVVTGAPVADRTVQLDEQAESYYPLASGNTWTFSVGADSTLTIGVYSTKDVRGVVTYTLGPQQGAHPPYLTSGVTTVHKYGYENQDGEDVIFSRPRVFVDFSAAPGHRWTIPGWGSVTLDESGLQVTVPAGTFLECQRLTIDKDGSADQTWWCAPGVGPVKMIDSEGSVTELLEYELH